MQSAIGCGRQFKFQSLEGILSDLELIGISELGWLSLIWFQSLEGILSDLESVTQFGAGSRTISFQSLEGILSDLEPYHRDSAIEAKLVSIPRRDFIGFRGRVEGDRRQTDGFQSLEGILSDLESNTGKAAPSTSSFQSLEGILSDLEEKKFVTGGAVGETVSIPRRDFIGFRDQQTEPRQTPQTEFQSLEGILSDLEG